MAPLHLASRVGILACVILLGAGCARKKVSRVDVHLAAAKMRLAEGKHDLAVREFKAALDAEPDHPKALGQFGILRFSQGHLVSAYLMLEKSSKAAPDDLEVRLAFGRVSQAVAKTADARAAAKAVLEKEPANEEAALLLAEACSSSRDNEESRRMLERLRDTQKPVAGYHTGLAILALGRRDFPAAEAELKKALALNPKFVAAHSVLGSLHAARNDNAKAREALKTAAALSSARSPARLAYVEFLLREKERDEARKELAVIIAEAPDLVPALTLDTKMLFEDQRYPEAIAAADKVLARDQVNFEALLRKADAWFAQGDMEKGITALKDMHLYHSSSPLVKYRLARAHLQIHDKAAAIDYLQDTVKLVPNFDDAVMLLAELNLERGNATAVVPALTELIRRQPKNGRAHLVLSRAHQALGNLAECLFLLRVVADSTPANPEGHFYVALVLDQMKRKDEARRTLERCLGLAGDFWPALEMLVTYDLVEQKLAAAKQRVRLAREKYPTRAEAWLLQAKIRLQEGDIEGAESDLLKGIELDPNQTQAYTQLALIHFRSNRREQALATLTGLAAKSNTALAYMQLGVLHSALNQRDEARQAYEKALSLDGRFVPALNNLAVLLSTTPGQLHQAEAIATRAREQAPGDPYVADTLGWILVRQGNHERALPFLRASAEKLPSHPEVQYHLGVAHYHLGQEKLAQQALQLALSAPPEAPFLLEVRERLAILALDPSAPRAEARTELEQRLQRDANDPVVLTRLAAILARAGDTAQAAERYEAALKLSPRAVTAMLSLGELYAGPLQKQEQARELAKSAQRLAPEDPQFAGKLGRLLNTLGEFGLAASVLGASAREFAKDPGYLLDFARANYGSGRIPAAEEALQQLLKLSAPDDVRQRATRLAAMIAAAQSPEKAAAAFDEARTILVAEPDDVAALMVTALALEQKRSYREAEPIYERLLARTPTFAPAMRQLALLHSRHLGDDKKAEELALKARQSFQDDPDLILELGLIQYRRGDYNAAIRFIRDSLRVRDNHPEAIFFWGMAHFQLKNYSDSKRHLERALRLNLPPQESAEARRVLQEISRGGRAL